MSAVRMTGIDTAWAKAMAVLPQGWGLSVGADGPGYRADANAGCNGPTITTWSVDDDRLVGDPDHPATPAKALLKLAAALRAYSEGEISIDT